VVTEDTNASMYPAVAYCLDIAFESHDSRLSLQLVRTRAASTSISGENVQPPRPLWKKRETVKQERTVEYTTIDADGAVQCLVEKETSEVG
jgi:hypothetical protein